jgi:hypothetical protein
VLHGYHDAVTAAIRDAGGFIGVLVYFGYPQASEDAAERAGGDDSPLSRGEASAFITARNIAPGGKLPLNTNGGGLSYMHSGMYGMYALQDSVRQMRGTAPAQIPCAKISVCHGVGGMFAASGTIIMSNEPP